MKFRSPSPSTFNIWEEDLQRCHDVLGASSWMELAGQSIFITGGTGFIGKWLVATLLDANYKLELSCRITVLSRDPAAFLRDWPDLENLVEWITGDVRTFPIDDYDFDVIIHAATDVATILPEEDILSTCIDGTRRVLNLAKQCGASKFLLVSSGAVYGPFPEGMTHVPETYFGGPDPLLKSSAYGEGKRVSEWLVSQAATNKFEVKIARVFALVGPHLPLNKHFAIGNFIFQALKGEAISIQGDGTPYRSYLYTADMAAWLWAILLRGQNKCAYNVGSDQSISIKELAEITCRILSCHQLIQIEKSSINDSSREIYVPNNFKIVNDLELIAPLSLEEAILRTSNWWNKFLDKIS